VPGFTTRSASHGEEWNWIGSLLLDACTQLQGLQTTMSSDKNR